jgi:hypothetical protein
MSLVDQLEQQVLERLKELEPLTREYEQLRTVAERLGLKYSPGAGRKRDGATPATNPRRSGKSASAKRAAGRPAKAKPAKARAGAAAAKRAGKQRGTRPARGSRTSAPAKASGATGAAAANPPRKRAAGSGPRSSRRRSAAPRGQRHDDVLRVVRENAGVTLREIGERLGVDSTGLYRVANRLTESGQVRKDGPRLYPADSAGEPSPAPADVDAPQPPSAGASEAPSASAEAVSGASPTPAEGSRSGAG